MTDCVADLMDRLYDDQCYTHQHLKVTSGWIKAHLGNSMRFQKGGSLAISPDPDKGKVT